VTGFLLFTLGSVVGLFISGMLAAAKDADCVPPDDVAALVGRTYEYGVTAGIREERARAKQEDEKP
jgi:hypothetical protein